MAKLTWDTLPPSAFTTHPFESVLQKTEAEVVARNIMLIRKRLNKWNITFDEYEAERRKDGSFSYSEEAYFKQVMPLIRDAIDCVAFSNSWMRAARKALAN